MATSTTTATDNIQDAELAEFDSIYVDSESCDKELFSEMRSNLLLVAGEHYTKRQHEFFRQVRTTKQLSEQQKIRLTKNHIQRICNIYSNTITASAPGVSFRPKNESETQDQKASELHYAVWRDIVERQNLQERIDEWADDFVQLGEVATKVFWDPDAGEIVRYEQEENEEGVPVWIINGEKVAMHVPEGMPLPGEPSPGAPIHRGDLVFEKVHGFNLLRAPEAKDMRESPYLIIRKMVDVGELKKSFPQHADAIVSSMDETMVVFDANKGGYVKAEGQVMVREFYFRPCKKYPQGYFCIATKEVKLASGELPGGIFPIVFAQYNRVQTSPRGRSPIKTMRPYQAEINRAASKIAEHQITLGDDKVLIHNGTKVTPGASLPGVRTINYTGMSPTILQGRDGSQYLAYLQAQIEELYDVMMVKEEAMDAPTGQLDAFALLHRSASQKKRFSRYIRRFERFLIDLTKTSIKLAKIHLPDDAFILAAGRSEQINIAEFRNATDIGYQIIVDASSEDIETRIGKQLLLSQTLQYVGRQLSREDIGKIMRSMPYGNFDESFEDFTMDADIAKNDILALDRGEFPQIQPYDNHEYLAKKLVARTRKPDFRFMPPQIQQNYFKRIQMHQAAHMEQLQKIEEAKNGFIPVGGYLVTCDFYVADPNNPTRTKRARVPYQAMEWLIKRLEEQGQALEKLEDMNRGALAEMAQQFMSRMQEGGAMPEGMGAAPRITEGLGQAQGAPGNVVFA